MSRDVERSGSLWFCFTTPAKPSLEMTCEAPGFSTKHYRFSHPLLPSFDRMCPPSHHHGLCGTTHGTKTDADRPSDSRTTTGRIDGSQGTGLGPWTSSHGAAIFGEEKHAMGCLYAFSASLNV